MVPKVSMVPVLPVKLDMFHAVQAREPSREHWRLAETSRDQQRPLETTGDQ